MARGVPIELGLGLRQHFEKIEGTLLPAGILKLRVSQINLRDHQ